MPILRNVERKIEKIEGFHIAFLQNGMDVRSDKRDIPSWPYSNRTDQDKTVAEWKAKFQQVYPGFDVAVYDANGIPVFGQMKLKNLRATYFD